MIIPAIIAEGLNAGQRLFSVLLDRLYELRGCAQRKFKNALFLSICGYPCSAYDKEFKISGHDVLVFCSLTGHLTRH